MPHTDEHVERSIVLDAAPEEVWQAITRDDLLQEWLGDEVTFDPSEGGAIQVSDGGDIRHGVVDHVDEPRRMSFRWWREGDDVSAVDLRVIGLPDGRTRLRVIESRDAQMITPQLSALATMLQFVPA
jgi:uncharacterized protein YndB with AHSA1/START domain